MNTVNSGTWFSVTEGQVLPSQIIRNGPTNWGPYIVTTLLSRVYKSLQMLGFCHAPCLLFHLSYLTVLTSLFFLAHFYTLPNNKLLNVA